MTTEESQPVPPEGRGRSVRPWIQRLVKWELIVSLILLALGWLMRLSSGPVVLVGYAVSALGVSGLLFLAFLWTYAASPKSAGPRWRQVFIVALACLALFFGFAYFSGKCTVDVVIVRSQPDRVTTVILDGNAIILRDPKVSEAGPESFAVTIRLAGADWLKYNYLRVTREGLGGVTCSILGNTIEYRKWRYIIVNNNARFAPKEPRRPLKLWEVESPIVVEPDRQVH